MADEPPDVLFFVAPLGEPDTPRRDRADAISTLILQPAATDHALRVMRADQLRSPGLITTQVLDLLGKSAVVAADLTGEDPNVFYQVGIAHGRGKPTLLFTNQHRGMLFDIREQRAISLPDKLSLDEVARARRHVSDALAAILSDRSVPPSSAIRTNRPTTCFISYSWEDTAFVDRLYRDLTQAGLSCWLDKHEILTGEDLLTAAEAGMAQADVFLIVLSAAAASSRWVQAEVSKALVLEAALGRPRVLPIAVDADAISRSRDRNPALVRRLWADFSNRHQYDRSLRHLLQSVAVATDPAVKSS